MKLLGVIILLLACYVVAFAQPATSPSGLNVRDFGAVGDGVADDTAAFEQALAAAAELPTGRAVKVPAGLYRLTRTLTLDSVLLIGLEAGGFPADTQPLPHLVVDVPAPAPCFIAKTGASLHGLEFDFLYTTPEREFGPAVRLEGGGVSLSNLLLHNPTSGIVADGTVNCGRVNLENLFIVNARDVGVRFEYALDVVTFRNVHVWNYMPELVGTCTGFLIGHVDEIRMSDCSVVLAKIGFHFVETELPDGRTGSVWGGMVNCTVDSSNLGIQVDSASVLRIQGGSLWAHGYGLILNGPGDVIVTGADLRANGAHSVDVREAATGTLTVTGCLFKKNGPNWPEAAKLNVNGPASVLVSGCQFDENSLGVYLGPKARRISFTGNVFATSLHPTLVHEISADCALVIANNLGL